MKISYQETKTTPPPNVSIPNSTENRCGHVFGAPIAPLIHVFMPFSGRIHMVTLVEVLFSHACTSCCSLLDLIVICSDRRFFLYAAGSLGGAKPPLSRSRTEVWWASKGSPLELRKSGILRYKIQPKNSTLWFCFLVQIEFKRKDHPFDVLNKANYTSAQI